MTDDPLPYEPECVNKTIRPLKILPFQKDPHKFRTYSAFWKREDLSAEEKGLIHIILSFTNKEGESWPTHPQLCAKARMGHCKLEKMLKKLRKMEEIDWTHFWDRYGRKRNRYTVLSFKKPTPTNQLLANTSKPVVKHSTIYPYRKSRSRGSSEGPDQAVV